MFRGNYPTRVDEKGRIKVPADFKRLVDEKYGNKFYITSKDGQVAEIYPLEEWEKIEQQLAKIPSMNEARKKFLNKVNYYGQMAEIDNQGRLLLPQILRESANLMGDVTVQGNLTYLEVRNRAMADALAKEAFTAEDAKVLETLGI
ncbi:MAG TPA: division/cell wall cluster transcriptional repressor MraZ [Terriglobales bacterium]